MHARREGALEVIEHRSLAEKAYELLVRKITRLELPPGTVLVDKALMEQCGIGRTPIREALQRLAIERLVDHLPNRGMLVSEITASGVQQIYEYRAMLDGYAAWLAGSRATEGQIGQLQLAHQRLVRAAEGDDVNEFVDGDWHFYRVLADASHNSLVADSIPRVFNLHLRLWFLISRRIGGWHPIAEAHEEMTKGVAIAVGQRDPETAELAMRMYISRRHQDLRNAL